MSALQAPAILELQNVTRRFGGLVATDDVSLSVYQGEILGINASVAALAQSIPPVIAGYLAAEIVAQAPIYVASLCIVLAGIIFWIFYKRTY